MRLNPSTVHRSPPRLAAAPAARYIPGVGAQGVNPDYFRRHRGPELTDAEFERALGLTEPQRRLAREIVAEVRTALARKARPSAARAKRRRAS